MKKQFSSPELVDEKENINKTELPNFELNLLLQKKSKLNFQGSIKWKTFLFPSLLKIASDSRRTVQYFGLDLVEEKNKRTYWTHKPSVWQDLFQTVQETAKTGKIVAISDIFNGILACPICAVPNGENEKQVFKSVKGQTIQHWILLVPMPVDIDSSEYIPLFISKFQALCKKPFIRSAYKSGVEVITKHNGLITQISQEGNYWHVLNNADQNNIIFQSNVNLLEVLMNQTIKDIVSTTFGVTKDPNTWTDSVKTYAYRN